MSTTVTANIPPLPPRLAPWPIFFLIDLGGIATLAASAPGSLLRPSEGDAPLFPAIGRQIRWMVGMGIPLVGLVHVSFGSFLAMQAYFGATFTEAAGAVVGLGLIRNVAPLLSGFVLAGLIAAKITSDLRGGPKPGLDNPKSVPDRDVVQGIRPDARPIPSRSRTAFTRMTAAVIAGPLLATWGALVGTLVGMLASKSMLGMSPAIFMGKIVEMLMITDVVGLIVKPSAFAAMAALISSYEGMRTPRLGEADPFRAILRSVVMILFLNFTWFNLVYLAGDPFGPNVVAAPAG